jgi:tRNA A37 threonylcarbamoyladenosine dehydratase
MNADMEQNDPATTSHNPFQVADRLYGDGTYAKLKDSHALVIGLGGVGSWCAELLARAGVGTLTLIDPDDICHSNVNRQLFALNSVVGKAKVALARDRLLDINPELKIHTIQDFFNEDSAEAVLQLGPTIMIDAIDRVKNKVLLFKLSKEKNIPLVMVGASGGKTDPTQIRVADLGKSAYDPLLMQVRRTLKRQGIYKGRKNLGVTVIYSDERIRYPDGKGGLCQTPPPGSIQKLDCHGALGSLGLLTSSFGIQAAWAALQILLGLEAKTAPVNPGLPDKADSDDE